MRKMYPVITDAIEGALADLQRALKIAKRGPSAEEFGLFEDLLVRAEFAIQSAREAFQIWMEVEDGGAP